MLGVLETVYKSGFILLSFSTIVSQYIFSIVIFSIQEISFQTLAEELKLDPGEDLEEFIIRAIQTNAIQVRLN